MNTIKELRESTKLSQNEFAKKFNIPVSTLRKWEQKVSKPPKYVVDFIESYISQLNNDYEIYFGNDNRNYYLDRSNKKVGDSLGNWIAYHEDISGVIEDNIGIYIEMLFSKYYLAIDGFDNDLKFDKIKRIKLR